MNTVTFTSRGGSRRLSLVISVLASTICANGSAQQALEGFGGNDGDAREVIASVGGSYSDNIRRSASQPESGSFSFLGLQSDIQEDSRRLLVDFDSDLEYRMYSKSGLDDELYGNMSALVEIDALPDRISWIFQDDYGQGRTDPFQVDSPENRAHVNVFATGPRFDVPLGQRTALRVAVLAGTRSIEGSGELDNDVLESSLGLARSINTNTEIGIEFSARDIDYEFDALNVELSTASIGYVKQLATGEARVRVGTNKADYGRIEESGPLVDIRWSRSLGVRSSLELSIGRQFVDAIQDFRFTNVNDLLLSSDVYERTGFDARFAMEWQKTTASAALQTVESEYVIQSNLNNDQTGLVLDVSHQMTSRTSLVANIATFNRSLTDAGVDDESRQWSLAVERIFGRGSVLQLRYADVRFNGLQDSEVKESVVSVAFQRSVLQRGTN